MGDSKLNALIAAMCLRECDACGLREERCWTDSWTGKELCNACVGNVVERVTNSPANEGDNLNELLDLEDAEEVK